MTAQRKRRLQNKIRAARERLLESHPFFALLLMYLKFVAVPNMKKMSTNGRCIYFSPDFVDKLYPNELEFVLCHQIVHIVFGHLWCPADFESDDYHFACDIFANATLACCGMSAAHITHLGVIQQTIPQSTDDPTDKAPSEILQQLPYSLYWFDERTRNRYLVDSDAWWKYRDENGFAGELVLDIDHLDGFLKTGNGGNGDTDSESGGGEGEAGDSDGETGGGDGETDDADLRQEWQQHVSAVVRAMQNNPNRRRGAGAVPTFAERILGKMTKPTLDWKTVVNEFVQEQICDYSFAPPDRRFSDTGFFLPDFNEKEFVPAHVLFMVDTSGSVGDDELATVYSEMCGAIEQFGSKMSGKLGFFDADVIPPIEFSNVTDLMSIVPQGGGGTDFTVIFEYLCTHCANDLPACVVIFTDGDGPYTDEADTLQIPVLWIINNTEITPPFGKVARVIPCRDEDE